MTHQATTLLTAADLMTRYEKGVHSELIRGVLYQRPPRAFEHGEIVLNLATPLQQFIRARRLGRIITSVVGIQLESNPDTVRIADLAYISAEQIPLNQQRPGYVHIPPRLVAEVIDPSDNPVAVYDKIQMWLRFGVILALLVDPGLQTVQVLPAHGPTRTLTVADTLDCTAVVPNFTLPVRDIFGLPAESGATAPSIDP